MNAKERWDEVKRQMEAEPLALSPKISATLRNSTHGLLFILARYKFAVKMMANRRELRVLDFGCNDGLGTLMIQQDCDCAEITGIDLDGDAIAWAKENIENEKMHFIQGDILEADVYPLGGDALVSLDVIEHIPPEDEQRYFEAVCRNLRDDGFAIIGTPNITMQPYASPWNKIAHINNYDQKRLYEVMSRYFENVFIFGMNDEVLHTGMYPFACYIMALGCGKKRR